MDPLPDRIAIVKEIREAIVHRVKCALEEGTENDGINPVDGFALAHATTIDADTAQKSYPALCQWIAAELKALKTWVQDTSVRTDPMYTKPLPMEFTSEFFVSMVREEIQKRAVEAGLALTWRPQMQVDANGECVLLYDVDYAEFEL